MGKLLELLTGRQLVLFAILGLTVMSRAQGVVTEEEKARVRSAANEIVAISTRPAWRSHVDDRLAAALDSRLAKWSRSTQGWIHFFNAGLSIKFSQQMDEVVEFAFRPRDELHATINGEVVQTAEEACLVAKGVLDAQLDGYWQSAGPSVDKIDAVSARISMRIARNGIPYATQLVRVTTDRVTGCVSRIEKTFSFLPRVAIGDGVNVTPADRTILHAKALDAYSRWRPLDEAIVLWREVSYNIPLFERHTNEMTEQHRQIMRDKKVMPVYRVGLQGTRAGRPVFVNVFVDVLAKRAMAIEEMYLDDNSSLGPTSAVSAKSPQYGGFSLVSGERLDVTLVEETTDHLKVDHKVLVLSRDGGAVVFNVDQTSRVLWNKTVASGVHCFRVSNEAWKLLDREVNRPIRTFGVKEDTKPCSCFSMRIGG